MEEERGVSRVVCAAGDAMLGHGMRWMMEDVGGVSVLQPAGIRRVSDGVRRGFVRVGIRGIRCGIGGLAEVWRTL